MFQIKTLRLQALAVAFLCVVSAFQGNVAYSQLEVPLVDTDQEPLVNDPEDRAGPDDIDAAPVVYGTFAPDAAPSCAYPVGRRYLAGYPDNFRDPVEPTAPSKGLRTFKNRVSPVHPERAFDEIGADKDMIHTFDKLVTPGETICTIRMDMRIRANWRTPDAENDSFTLFFVDGNGNPFGNGWSRYIGSGQGAPGLISKPWNWHRGNRDFTFFLDQLPLAYGGTVNLIPMLRTTGFMDMYVQDDTRVDYVQFTIFTPSYPPPTPTPGPCDVIGTVKVIPCDY